MRHLWQDAGEKHALRWLRRAREAPARKWLVAEHPEDGRADDGCIRNGSEMTRERKRGTWQHAAGGSLSYEAYAAFAALPDERLLAACEVQVFRATGPGGQGVNTTDSAVRMVHIPTGITVSARESRSQYRNRAICLEKLRRELERRARRPRPRKKTKPTAASRERRLKNKRIHAEKKAARSRVDW